MLGIHDQTSPNLVHFSKALLARILNNPISVGGNWLGNN
jgi:hypothetical protein